MNVRKDYSRAKRVPRIKQKVQTKWIKGQLERVGLAQVDLANRLGLSEGQLTRTLQGKRIIQAWEISPIAQMLDITLEDCLRAFGCLYNVKK